MYLDRTRYVGHRYMITAAISQLRPSGNFKAEVAIGIGRNAFVEMLTLRDACTMLIEQLEEDLEND